MIAKKNSILKKKAGPLLTLPLITDELHRPNSAYGARLSYLPSERRS